MGNVEMSGAAARTGREKKKDIINIVNKVREELIKNHNQPCG